MIVQAKELSKAIKAGQKYTQSKNVTLIASGFEFRIFMSAPSGKSIYLDIPPAPDKAQKGERFYVSGPSESLLVALGKHQEVFLSIDASSSHLEISSGKFTARLPVQHVAEPPLAAKVDEGISFDEKTSADIAAALKLVQLEVFKSPNLFTSIQAQGNKLRISCADSHHIRYLVTILSYEPAPFSLTLNAQLVSEVSSLFEGAGFQVQLGKSSTKFKSSGITYIVPRMQEESAAVDVDTVLGAIKRFSEGTEFTVKSAPDFWEYVDQVKSIKGDIPIIRAVLESNTLSLEYGSKALSLSRLFRLNAPVAGGPYKFNINAALFSKTFHSDLGTFVLSGKSAALSSRIEVDGSKIRYVAMTSTVG